MDTLEQSKLERSWWSVSVLKYTIIAFDCIYFQIDKDNYRDSRFQKIIGGRNTKKVPICAKNAGIIIVRLELMGIRGSRNISYNNQNDFIGLKRTPERIFESRFATKIYGFPLKLATPT